MTATRLVPHKISRTDITTVSAQKAAYSGLRPHPRIDSGNMDYSEALFTSGFPGCEMSPWIANCGSGLYYEQRQHYSTNISMDPAMLYTSDFSSQDFSYNGMHQVPAAHARRRPKSMISPLMSQAELLPCNVMPVESPESIPGYMECPNTWQTTILTPPPEPMLYQDDLGLFPTQEGLCDTADLASGIEYLGPSKIQPSAAARSPHRAIRSASERRIDNHSPVSVESLSSAEMSSARKNNPRNDPRYEAKPDKNGLYHCPFVRKEGCTHAPTKQKCIYAKNLDSHLKPYNCKSKDENCRNLRFSSNACLFRHEREMHGLHNHGMNPYLCKYVGCERARADNGFPRRWNQRDHMKRVHGWEEPDSSDNAPTAYIEPPRRRKGPGPQSVIMKRTSSSRAGGPYATGPRAPASRQGQCELRSYYPQPVVSRLLHPQYAY